jgi:Mrp family chromosome partitioning ATPase
MLRLEKSVETSSMKRRSKSTSSGRRFANLLSCLRTGTNGKATTPTLLGIIGCHRSTSSPTLAAELASVAAAEMGQRTLAVDISGRGSNMPRLLGCQSHPGITDVLAGDEPPDACIINGLGGGGMSFIPWGADDTNAIGPSEVQRFAELLEELRSHFELVVVALPPATETSPGPALAACVDGVLLEIESERTQVTAARRAQLLLERSHARVLGAILSNSRDYLPAWLRSKV